MEPFRTCSSGASGGAFARQLAQNLSGAAVGYWGGEQARQLARQAVGGLRESGGRVLLHGLSSAAQNAWAARSTQTPAALFFLQEGEQVSFRLTDGWGLPLTVKPPSPCASGGVRLLRGSKDAYIRDAARAGLLGHTLRRGPRVAVDGHEPADEALRLVLRRMGCQVLSGWRQGVPCLRTGDSGLSLSARDESGTRLSPSQLLAAVALVELESGSGRLAVSDETGAAAELLAAHFSRPVLRLGRDGEQAVRLYRALPWLYDGVFAAARLCARMRACGERLEQLYEKTPHLTAAAQELPLRSAPDELLARLRALDPGWTAVGSTLRRRTALGWVSLIPLRHPAVRVLAESENMETAAELCRHTLSRVQQLDGQTK